MAALAGATLEECLRTHRRDRPEGELAGLAWRAHRELARPTRTAWLLATGEDLHHPTTRGARPDLRTRLMHRYLNRLGRVMTSNRTVNAAFLDVANLIRPPAALFHPRVLGPTLRARPTSSVRPRSRHQATGRPAPPGSAPMSLTKLVSTPAAADRLRGVRTRRAEGPVRSTGLAVDCPGLHR